MTPVCRTLVVWAFCCLPLGAFGTAIQYGTLPRAVVEERLRAAPRKNADRERMLRELLAQAGCAAGQLQTQVVKHVKLPNVVCTVEGQSEATIVVGAHFDCVPAGQGVIDNWSGAALLPSLLQSIISTLRRHRFVFVGFTDEEQGLVGSRFYVDHLSKEERGWVRAMVNIDSLGTGPTELELDRGDKRLASALASVSQTLGLPLSVVNVHRVGRSDSDSFQDRHIPSVSIHSLTQETFPILHSRRDRLDAVHWDDYYGSYRMLAAYLAYLDELLDPPDDHEADLLRKRPR